MERKTCWIKSRIRLSVVRGSLYGVICANCRMEVDAGVDWDVECSGCYVVSPMEVRLRLPVTLADESLRGTLKSPDAEKICPFSAIKLKKHEDEHVSVVNDISVEMDNTEVVCFVKYYDKRINGEMIRRYVILKLYTLDELQAFAEEPPTQQDTAVRLDSQSSTAAPAEPIPLSPSQEPTGAAEAQIFTPTMKKIGEQIGGEASGTRATTAHASPAKRAISFGTVTEEDLENVSRSSADPSLLSPMATPNKKTKAVDKHS